MECTDSDSSAEVRGYASCLEVSTGEWKEDRSFRAWEMASVAQTGGGSPGDGALDFAGGVGGRDSGVSVSVESVSAGFGD